MAHQTTIQFFRGPFADLPTLAAGEPGFCTDTYQFFIGDGATNHEIGAGATYTNENAQDAVGGILTDTSTIDFTYNDGANTIEADVKANSVGVALMHASATGVIFGRSTAGAGAGEEIACTAAGRALIDDADAAAQRTTLGATTVGGNLFTLTNPGAITFPRLNADNTVDALSASAFRTAIGAGTGGGDLLAANNLSDVANASTARTNLGLGTAAVVNTGTSGATIPLLNGANTWSGSQIFLNASGVKILDTDASHTLGLVGGSNLSADRTLTLTTGDANRTLTMSGDATISGTNTGDQTITLTGQVTGSGTGSFAATLDKTAITDQSADATPDAATDYVLTYDASATALKKVLIQNLPTGGVPTTITVADTTDSTCSVALFESATGDLAPKTDGGLTYNASTGTLTATAFSGPLTGNVTGNVTGSSGSCTGNAATVTTNANLTGEVTSTGNAAVLDKTAITNQTADASPSAANDYILTYDASATSLKKVLIQNLPGFGGDVTAASTFGANNSVIVADGTGKGVKNCGVVIDASGNTTGFGTVAIGGHTTIGGGATASELRLQEPSGGGASYAGFKAPSLAGNLIWSLPSTDAAGFMRSDGSLGLSLQAAATQAEQEAASSTSAPVTPGRQHFHPSACKAWIKASYSGGSMTINANYNFTSATRDSQGNYSFVIDTDLSSAHWSATVSCEDDSGVGVNIGQISITYNTMTAGAISIEIINNTGTGFVDPLSIHIHIFGDI